MANMKKRRGSRGFTLTEMLVTVAIVIVLFALAMVPISKMQRNMRQTELDSKAEMLFMAAQNRLAVLQAAGRQGAYQAGTTDITELPQDADPEQYEDEELNLCYVTSADKSEEGTAAANIVPEDKTDAELWNANWVIEYDKVSGSVYAVFYSEKADGLTDYSPNGDFSDLRYRNNRLKAGAKVGYYGGDSVGANETGDLNPVVQIINEEQLLVKIDCDIPNGMTPHFYVKVEDEDGNTSIGIGSGEEDEIELLKAEKEVTDTADGHYTAILVLDDLSDGKSMRFAEQQRLQHLVPGEDLTVTVRVAVDNDLIDDAVIVKKTNSLFAFAEENETGRTAYIEYARHLQNLDEDSGVEKLNALSAGKTVNAAVQRQDIAFAAEGDSWKSLYGSLTFQPIRNRYLESYRSSMRSGNTEFHPVIYDLPVDTNGDAGLFDHFDGGTLSYIRLAGAQISGTGNVGGLIGTASGNVQIEGCQVFLSEAKGQLEGKTEQDIWIKGETTGGLIGTVTKGNVNISGSFAATVLEGAKAAGGLIGNVKANVAIENSYADCYIYSTVEKNADQINEKAKCRAGGLIGARPYSTYSATITNCYAAGFLEGTITAGLVADDMSGTHILLTNVYSACASLDGSGLTYGTALRTGSENPNTENVFYLGETQNENETIGTHASFEEWSGANLAAAAKTLGSAFTADTGDTNAYNLMKGMGLTNYSYPKLKDLAHYGDWQAKFEADALVYYEDYGSSYGIYGANVSTLSDAGTVKGDGYGVIRAASEDGDVAVTDAASGKTYTLSAADAVSVMIKGQDEKVVEYKLLKLPKELVQDVTEVPAAFYREVKVNGRSYFYNPHFASTVVTAASTAPQNISVRTARQLYNLSLYYDKYAAMLPTGAAFRQSRGIDYAAYDWTNYGLNGAPVSTQTPIGKSDKAPFTHTYDGGAYPITGVSFASEEDGVYAGMFGVNEGALRSVVLTTDKALDDENVPTVTISGVVQHKTVYIGTLAGVNYGTVTNCSVSGYVHEGRTYNGYAYIGALAGYNSGIIRSSSAVSPLIDEEGTFAYLYVGGFTGGNSGQIRQSYAMANIEILGIRGGETSLAGFAAENYGTIRDSYCATALSSAGGDTYGFAPNSGSVSNCYYLNGGTYSFAGGVHLYDYKLGSAEGVTDEQLATLNLSGFGAVDASHTDHYPNTVIKEGETAVYPYPSSFSGTDGQPTHYGDWVTKADMGMLGVVYWEYESGGSNGGYHFSFIGFDSGIEKRGSSLCTAHDDGGAVTRYGYGYYTKKNDKTDDEESVKTSLTAAVKDGNAGDAFVLGDRAEDIEEKLAQQVPGFAFVAYETADNGLHLESSDAANGYWTLTQQSKDKPNETLSYKFELCPFFANAYTVVEKPDTGAAGGAESDAAEDEKAELGKETLPYEVRSLAQLQYINWSYARSVGTSGTLKGSTATNVTSATYKFFPYLQYTTNTGTGKQDKANAEKNHAARAWTQMHDLCGTAETNFHPIAGAVFNSNRNSYDMVLYTWFGGKYDGQSYYIKNVNINSYCYNVGLFGTTAGANIWNVVLYSDNSSVIQRSTKATNSAESNSTEQYVTAYALGGLVGIAYDYDVSTNATIENCAIAGYEIVDNSKNKLSLGEAAIGGLIGVSRADLRNCSAVVDIKINCTHRWANGGALNSAKWGNFIRVGGLVGGLRDTATNCYTGGSIEVSDDTLIEQVLAGDDSNTKLCPGNKEENVKSAEDGSSPATYVYVGGIGGSGFSANFKNFTGKDSDSTDGTPKFVNCYTYIKLPAMEGTISGIAIIGSVADRFKWTTAYVDNCYYLENTRKSIDFTNASKNKCKGRTSLYSHFNDQKSGTSNQDKMLSGDMSYARVCFWGDWKTGISLSGLTSLTYAQMASRSGGVTIKPENGGANKTYTNFKDALGLGFDWVTVDEGGASIHGKYSFPGSDTALAGQDYPFPTVLTQQTDTGTVNLHYGTWPKVGLYWSQGIATLDLIETYDAETGRSVLPLKLLLENVDDVSATAEPTFECSTENIVKATATRLDDGSFDVALEGLQVGATEVTAALGQYTARMTVTVTADLIVKAEPSIIEKYAGETTDVTLTATDRSGKDVPNVTWKIVNSNSDAASYTQPAEKVTGGTAETKTVMSTTVTNLDEGETNLQITAIWKPNTEYRGSTVLTVTTLASNVIGVSSNGSYYEGMLDQTLIGWETGKEPAAKTYDSDAPSCGDNTLFLYFRGAEMDPSGFTVKSIEVGTTDALSGTGDYTAVVGEAVKSGSNTCLPITLYGEAASTTLTITLADKTGREYRFTDIPATAQTSVTATFVNQTDAAGLTRNVPYGTMPSVGTDLPTLTPPEGYQFQGDLTDLSSWTATPEIVGNGVRRPTTFEPVLVKKNATDAK